MLLLSRLGVNWPVYVITMMKSVTMGNGKQTEEPRRRGILRFYILWQTQQSVNPKITLKVRFHIKRWPLQYIQLLTVIIKMMSWLQLHSRTWRAGTLGSSLWVLAAIIREVKWIQASIHLTTAGEMHFSKTLHLSLIHWYHSAIRWISENMCHLWEVATV